jgi:uncharacterized protein (DUF2336 family)
MNITSKTPHFNPKVKQTRILIAKRSFLKITVIDLLVKIKSHPQSKRAKKI